MNEFDIIQHFLATQTQHHSQVIQGIGDDAAVWQPTIGCQTVLCVDSLVAEVHFKMNDPAHAIAWKSVAVNLSDLAAMGAAPKAILLALSLPPSLATNPHWLGEFIRGLSEICQQFQVALIGGDTTHSNTLSITITAIGEVQNSQAITRFGAKVGDAIAVSGTIGDAAAALATGHPELMHALHYPQPQIELGLALRGIATSCIDISDGLWQDLSHILKASQLGATLDLAYIPCSNTLSTFERDQRLAWMLAGGDDYQLCFTLPTQQLSRLTVQGFKVTQIGHICSGNQIALRWQQHDYQPPFTLHGYQHFRPS